MSEDDGIDITILNDFVEESLILVGECLQILESIEDYPSEVEQLKAFANLIDRVMGAAKSLALMATPHHPLNLIGDYCDLCKSVGYQGAGVQGNDVLYSVVVAFLIDAVEIVKIFLGKIDSTVPELKKQFTTTFLERLKWISFQFDEMAKNTGRSEADRLQQNEIDKLLKKLGMG